MIHVSFRATVSGSMQTQATVDCGPHHILDVSCVIIWPRLFFYLNNILAYKKHNGS